MKDYIYFDVIDALNHTNAIRRKQVKSLDRRVRCCAIGTLLCVSGLLMMIFEQEKEIKRLNRLVDENDDTIEDLRKRVTKLESKDIE